jgi:hypothetical protein
VNELKAICFVVSRLPGRPKLVVADGVSASSTTSALKSIFCRLFEGDRSLHRTRRNSSSPAAPGHLLPMSLYTVFDTRSSEAVQARRRPCRRPYRRSDSRPELEQRLAEPFVPLGEVKIKHFVGFRLAANNSDQRVFFVALPGLKAGNQRHEDGKIFEGGAF